ncbi:MAG TPA: site-specific integrase [Longimicrobiales bacterium]|nr:site-specific integrase [Longimicrobiales bacterium]
MARKLWKQTIEAHGIRVRLYEHRRSSCIWRDVRVNGSRSRKSLGHGDQERAIAEATALCRELAKARLTGATPETLTLGQLHAVYLRECGDMLTHARQRLVDKAFRLLFEHLGTEFQVVDLGPHQVTTYTAARREGRLAARGGRHGGGAVRAGTIAKELGVLHRALNWAALFKRNGKALISHNPIRGVPLPSEPNPARPVASRDRYQRLLEQAPAVDPRGAFAAMLEVAWTTGRRLGSIVALRASDLMLTPELVRRGLADAGKEEWLGEAWPAAVRWAAEADKEGVEWIVPIPASLTTSLAEYVRARGLVGNALLFPARRDPTRPVSKETAYYWVRRGEALAELPHQRRGGWHALRRAWATARKHMPLQDVMAAGGWRDAAALQRAYQHADPETVRAVMEVEA